MSRRWGWAGAHWICLIWYGILWSKRVHNRQLRICSPQGSRRMVQPGALVASLISLWLLWWPPTGSSMFMEVVMLLMYSVLHCSYSVGNEITTTTTTTTTTITITTTTTTNTNTTTTNTTEASSYPLWPLLLVWHLQYIAYTCRWDQASESRIYRCNSCRSNWNSLHRKCVCRRPWDTRHRVFCQTSEVHRFPAQISGPWFCPRWPEVPFPPC